MYWLFSWSLFFFSFFLPRLVPPPKTLYNFETEPTTISVSCGLLVAPGLPPLPLPLYSCTVHVPLYFLFNFLSNLSFPFFPFSLPRFSSLHGPHGVICSPELSVSFLCRCCFFLSCHLLPGRRRKAKNIRQPSEKEDPPPLVRHVKVPSSS